MDASFGRGPTEARVLGSSAACPVVVDVLSFTAAVGVAEEAGTAVYPYRWRDGTARAYAEQRNAAAAVGRSVAALLRNRKALARRPARQGYGTASRPLAVAAAGERRPDGSLRPAPEDLPGAGAVLSALCAEGGAAVLTPEARAAATLWEATEDPAAVVHHRGSGRELYEYGYPQDVAVATEVDTSHTVPVLTDGAFQEAAA
ncbi:2-phosphosulfolactate phosphatase [Streptomyces sp. NPDC047434]|uniref:2-phosphosulfolactate phosphatase n=1 Tax=Streptomyces sp. NPDC047434 TaxID=3155143 RepID=UPI003401AA53